MAGGGEWELQLYIVRILEGLFVGLSVFEELCFCFAVVDDVKV